MALALQQQRSTCKEQTLADMSETTRCMPRPSGWAHALPRRLYKYVWPDFHRERVKQLLPTSIVLVTTQTVLEVN
eukprot:6181354-Pleurochrysis_carterae.AAC.5